MKRLLLLLSCISTFYGCSKFEQGEPYKDGFSLTLDNAASVKAGNNSVLKIIVEQKIKSDNQLTVDIACAQGGLDQKKVPFVDNKAVAYFTIGVIPKEYYITATVYSDSKLVTSISKSFQPVAVEDTAIFQVADTSGVRADGVSTIRLEFEKFSPTNKPLRVSFTANPVTSFSNTAVPLSGNKASVFMKVTNVPGTYYLTATLLDDNTTVLEKHIVFNTLPAFPSVIALFCNKQTFNLSSPLILKTTLFDAGGNTNISKGLKVNFFAFQLNASNAAESAGPIDASNIRTGDLGAVSDITFQPNPDMDSLKKLYIRAYTTGANNQEISDTLIFNYRL